MVYLLSQTSKYLLILLIAIFTFQAFLSLSSRKADEDRAALFSMQRIEIALLLFVGLFSLYAATGESQLILYFGLSLALLLFIELFYGLVYRHAPRQILNNMCMLLCIGFVIQARLDLDAAMRQLIITAAAAFGMLLVPLLIRKLSFLDRLTWVYAAIGIAALAVVLFLGATSYGAKLSVSLGGLSFQPSEFIKIVFVFFVAAIFSKATDFKTVVRATIVAAVHVLLLVASKDLGAALLFFMVYLVMLYVATRKVRYLFLGAAAGAAACVAAYYLFSHVQTRVVAWLDPWSVIDNEGYQIAQSLFAIGSGGWFGTGLGQGLPTAIPVVEEDFVFSAIAEEMGGIFAICLVLVCLCCYILILNIAMQIHRLFHKLIALGLGTVYIFQVFLTVGGATKFIPSTGVTLPFISIGGSSLVSTFLLFNIILGLYLFRMDELRREEEDAPPSDTEKQQKKQKRKKKYDDEPIEDPVIREVKIPKGTRRKTASKQTTDVYRNLEVTLDPDEIEDYRIDLEK